MDKSRRNFLIAIIAASIITGSVFAFGFDHPVKGDALDYDRIGQNLAQGNGFSLSQSCPYIKTMYREPAYPVFLALIYSIFGHNFAIVKLLQIFIYALSCILLFYLALIVFNEKIARISSALFSIFATSANYPSYLLTETLFTCLLISVILILSLALARGRSRLFFYSGVLLGMSILCKAAMLLFFIPIFLVLYLKIKQGVLKYFMILLAGSLLVLTPWMARNYLEFGAFSITLRSGTQLLYRAQNLDNSLEKIKATIVYSISERLGKKIYPYWSDNPADFLDKDLNIIYKEEIELRQKGYTDVDIDRLETRNALALILRRPAAYLMQSPLELIKLSAFAHIPLLNQPDVIEKFDSFKNGPLVMSMVRGVFHLLSYLILLLTITGMWLSRGEWRNWILMAGLIFYINAVHSMLFASARYTVPLIPFYLIFTSHALVKILEKNKKNSLFSKGNA